MNQLTELRNIIIGEQQEELVLLRQRLEESRIDSEKLAKILPKTLKLLSVKSGGFTTDTQLYISKSVFKAVEDDSHGFAEVLYPALMPAIRLMLTNSIRALTNRVNTTIESTTTAQGLKWRFEALRTGEPYSDVVVRKTLDYRVEQLFLLKPDSGILLEHLVNEDIGAIDSDAIAAMFSAIQSFVSDSFQSDDTEKLNQISVGNLNVWLVHRPTVTLACVIRGSIPFELRDTLDTVQDSIYSRFAPQIKSFDGSQPAILGVRELLEPCLQFKLKSGQEKSNKTSIGSVVFLLLIIGLIGFGFYSSAQKKQMLQDVENLLFVTPGIVTTDIEWKNGYLRVSGLKDPDAEIPWTKMKEHKVNIERVDIALKTLKDFRSLQNLEK